MKQDITSLKNAKRADLYDDPKHNYLHYWDGRDYEKRSEEIAIRKLLKNKHFKTAADIGGGYGRLCVLLSNFADEVNLIEPSKQQLDIAKTYLKDYPNIKRLQMAADNLKFKDNSIDLITLIRVMHHLPDPTKELKEIYRVLSEDGLAIIELANFSHFINRLNHLAHGKKLPYDPVDIRSPENRRDDEIPFVNHNPKKVIKQLNDAGFNIVKILSVSNLRSSSLKKILPSNVMAAVESSIQKPLAKIYFGPSIFFLVNKKY